MKASKQVEEPNVSYILLNRDELLPYGNTYEFEGKQYGDTNISFIWVDMPPGDSIRLHKHPYEEVFIIQEGVVTFTVDTTTLKARQDKSLLSRRTCLTSS